MGVVFSSVHSWVTDLQQQQKLCLSLMIVSLSALICESYNIDHTMDMNKKGYRDPDDPRNLFAAMYGGVYKRRDPYDLSELRPDQLQYFDNGLEKRGPRRSYRGWSGLKDPYDPRNLFHSIYGGIWKRK